MLSLRYREPFALPVQLPVDDYTFNMVLTRGRVVSKAAKPMYVEAIDASDGLVFQMTLLDATTIAAQHDFDGGLVGQWRLANTGYVKLVKAFDSKCPDAVRAFLLEPQSHAFMRLRYATALK